MIINIEENWKNILNTEFEKESFKNLSRFVKSEYVHNICYPEEKNIFSAFNTCSFENLKVVIIGQDPYHGPNQAMGLSFAVSRGIKLPPSLRNIYKELQNDLGIVPAKHGDLSSWAEQVVLLLNATLTVEANKPQSHANIGWQTFTDAVIRALNQHPDPIVFLLWGAYAQKKQALIDLAKHRILKTTHPSPLSAHRGFLGSKVFSKTNELLEVLGRQPINWQIPE